MKKAARAVAWSAPRSEEAVLNPRPMIHIAVTEAAFHAVAALPLGRVVYEPRLNAQGERLIWVERIALDKLDAMRGADESYSDVILRLAAGDERHWPA